MISNLKIVKDGSALVVSYEEDDGRLIRARMIEAELVSINKPITLLKTKVYFKNGIIHREDGPAAEHFQGTKLWYLDGKEYTFNDYWEIQLQTDIGKTIFTKFFSNEQQK